MGEEFIDVAIKILILDHAADDAHCITGTSYHALRHR